MQIRQTIYQGGQRGGHTEGRPFDIIFSLLPLSTEAEGVATFPLQSRRYLWSDPQSRPNRAVHQSFCLSPLILSVRGIVSHLVQMPFTQTDNYFGVGTAID